MRAIIKVNGVEVPESLACVDTASNIVTLETVDTGEIKMEMERVYVEVSIFGMIDLEA